MSVAAAGTAALLEGLEIPEQVETLLIFADKDANKRGAHAARVLESRVSSRMNVRIIFPSIELKPSDKSKDWLDEVVYNVSSLELMKNEVII